MSKEYGIQLRCYWERLGTCLELDRNSFRLKGEKSPNPPPPPKKKKKTFLNA
jgi:hypothetical protein